MRVDLDAYESDTHAAAERAHRHAVEIDPLRQDGAGEALAQAELPPPRKPVSYTHLTLPTKA